MTHSPNGPKAQSPEQVKVSPAKALHKLITEGRSGRLTLTDPTDPSLQWRTFFGGGQVHFAECLAGQTERLPYVLNEHLGDTSLQFDPAAPSEYQWVCDYWRSQQLQLNWVRQILSILTQEALTHFLAIPQAHIQYESSIGLDPLLLSVPFRQLILPIRDSITAWAQLQPELSPLQRPHLLDADPILKAVWNDAQLRQRLQNIDVLLSKNLTLYEVAGQLSTSVLEVAQFLRPFVREGVVEMHPFKTLEAPQRPLVACVDDSPTIQQFVKLSLEAAGYDVLSILDPTAAIGKLLDHRPSVILMDIEMPKVDGYELCRSARQIQVLSEIPIVMLTGREGIIDRVRARMAGCTAYLTKPFNPQELLNTVQKLSQNEMVAPL